MEKLRSVLVTDRTQADVKARNDKGTYNYIDLNRVLRACAWLAERLERYGYEIPFDYHKVCLIAVKAQPENGGIVYGALCYSGETVTIKAEVKDGFWFKGWTENGETVTTDLEYTLTADNDRDFVALFEVIGDSKDGVVGVGKIGLALTGRKGD